MSPPFDPQANPRDPHAGTPERHADCARCDGGEPSERHEAPSADGLETTLRHTHFVRQGGVDLDVSMFCRACAANR